MIRSDLYLHSAQQRRELLFECSQKAGILPPESEIGYFDRLCNVFQSYSSGFQNYTAQPYDGRIAYFRATESIFDDTKMNFEFWTDQKTRELAKLTPAEINAMGKVFIDDLHKNCGNGQIRLGAEVNIGVGVRQ